ncbi:MAG TPA: DNA adenine methylase [Sandaracinaceae bacterium LLY-WYZ-13_1]|nr:DNA adenine methylase [Sandaracinaceae bacterium LLY-WYZ-13_1]
MIKYIGSKRLLLDPIVAAVTGFGEVRTALDLFSGTARVGRALKRAGLRVTANDHLAYAATLARCYVAADGARWRAPARALLDELGRSEPVEGYFTRAFCREARYLQPDNGRRVDGIREAIAARDLPPPLEAIALTSLMEAADRVDSTTGVQMAYLKKWARRSFNPLSLRLPELTDGPGEALRLEAAEAAEVDADVAYLDPPYNQHSYLGNYHVWETLVRWDAPERYGVANKRVDCRTYKNPFNSRRRIAEAFERVLSRLRARHVVVSFNDEGFLDRGQLEAMLASRGHVRVLSTDFKRYVGAQIGIHDPKGRRVGEVKKLRNREMLFLVSPERASVERAARAAEARLKPAQTSLDVLA